MSDNEVAVKAHIGAADVKPRSGGRSHNFTLKTAAPGYGVDSRTRRVNLRSKLSRIAAVEAPSDYPPHAIS